MSIIKIAIIHLALLLLVLSPFEAFSRSERRILSAKRVDGSPTFDGKLGDQRWHKAEVASDFFQYEPHNNRPSSFRSEVRVLYDDHSIYIGAFLHDPSPDSILTELGLRDADNRLNADQFWVDINPFNDGLNSFRFKVSASGVQTDVNYSVGSSERGDINWDAVWRSNVSITHQGWVVEMEIPYSALRLPNTPTQEWGINFWREVRRSRESSSWNFVDRTAGNLLASKGILTNLQGIKPPVRLSLYPYITTYLEKNGANNNWRGLATGGMDLKYGINKSFTIDMALIPDFGQVKSDDQVLNLSPFEVMFDENRQFFTEGVDLFSKADLFYSRRIGSTPRGRSKVAGNLMENEIILENPTETRLINASKLSGRTSKGLGVGIFNAITSPANALVVDTLTNVERRENTQPLTNYNLIAFDQSLANNSSVSLVNSNVWGAIDGYMANVTGTEFQINDSSNRYRLSGSGAVSQQYFSDKDDVFGFKYFISLGKTGGTWQYRYSKLVISHKYEQNDLGFLRRNNRKMDQFSLSYNLFNPSPSIINSSVGVNAEYARLFEPSAFTDLFVGGNFRILFTSRLFVSLSANVLPIGSNDYFEPRTPGRFYKSDPEYSFRSFFSTDYRRKVYVDGNISYRKSISEINRNQFSVSLDPTMRFTDKFNVSYGLSHSINHNDIGFVRKVNNESIIFGVRNNTTTTNRLRSSYIFNNVLSLDVQLRHYWSRVSYNGSYFELNENGELDNWDEPFANNDINFNAFTIDTRITWNFAPGSQLSLVWKNSIETRGSEIPQNFLDNLQNTLGEPQINSISLKVLYYIDYHKVRNLFSS